MGYFSQDFLDFFCELKANNSKAWFDENRKRYQKSVKEPFEFFVNDVIQRVRTIEPEVDISAKDAILRINRDIRFSKDKTPYNTHVSALVSKYGRKNKCEPGLFFRLSADSVGIMGGRYMLEVDQLQRIRKTIQNDLPAFAKLTDNPQFKEKYGGFRGEKHKRIPAEFKDDVNQQPLLANKQFYYMAELPAGFALADDLLEKMINCYLAAAEVKAFLVNATKNESN